MSGIVEPWPLPSRWTWALFEDVAQIAQNLVAPSQVLDMPHIAPNHIGTASRELFPYSTVRNDAVISPKQRFFPGQILFTKIRPYLLKSVLVDFEGVCSADMYPLSVRSTIHPALLLYWLTSPDFRDEIALEQGRSVLPKINQPALNRSRVPLPPFPEQRRIVAKIDSLTAKSRRARDHLDHIPRLVEKYKQAVLAAAFRGDLTRGWRTEHGRDLDTWKIVTLGEIAEIQSGVALGKKRRPNIQLVRRPYLRVANVQRGRLDLSEVKTIEVTETEAATLTLRLGDILMNEGGDRDKLGRGWVWEGQIDICIHQNHVFRVRLKDKSFPPELISLYANEFGQEHFFDEGTQTTNLASISKRRLSLLPLVLPPADEAVKMRGCIRRAFTWIDRLAAEATSARALVDRLDQAVLAKAFRGELVLQDPADEPASVLLERIRAERAASPKPKRGRRPKAAR